MLSPAATNRMAVIIPSVNYDLGSGAANSVIRCAGFLKSESLSRKLECTARHIGCYVCGSHIGLL
jgi:hypothetical protein